MGLFILLRYIRVLLYQTDVNIDMGGKILRIIKIAVTIASVFTSKAVIAESQSISVRQLRSQNTPISRFLSRVRNLYGLVNDGTGPNMTIHLV